MYVALSAECSSCVYVALRTLHFSVLIVCVALCVLHYVFCGAVNSYARPWFFEKSSSSEKSAVNHISPISDVTNAGGAGSRLIPLRCSQAPCKQKPHDAQAQVNTKAKQIEHQNEMGYYYNTLKLQTTTRAINKTGEHAKKTPAV